MTVILSSENSGKDLLKYGNCLSFIVEMTFNKN